MTEGASSLGDRDSDKRVVDLDSALWRRLLTQDDESAFFESWLALQARQLPGVQNAVLVILDDDGQLRPASYWPKGVSPGMEALKAAQSATRRKTGVVRRTEATETGAEGARSTFAYPVLVGGDTVAVAAFTVSQTTEADLQAALRRVQWGAVWMENHFSAHRREVVTATATRLSTALELIALSFENNSAKSAGLAVTTEAASRLNAVRVSLGQRRGHTSRLVAISHTAQFSRRQNLVRAICEAMDEAIDLEQLVVYPPEEDSAIAMVKHRELSQKLGAGGPIITIPLHNGRKFDGACTVEFSSDHKLEEGDVDLVEAAANVAARVLELRRNEERWLITKALKSLWRQLGRILGPGYLGRKLFLLAVVASTVFFYFYTVDFRVPARATLEGEVQRILSAPFDGYIAEEFARPGDIVKQGDLLARLDDRELQLELAAWQSRRAQYEAERQNALAERDIASSQVYGAQIAEADVQIDLAHRQIGFATIRAPFDGLVLSGDLSQGLGAAIRLGDPLFQLAPLSSYRVFLRVDEEDVTLVEAGQTGSLVLTSRPGERLDFTLNKITSVTLPEEGKNYFRVEAHLAEASQGLRPGMEGAAKISTGEQKLIWIWTRRATNWLRLQAWKWMP